MERWRGGKERILRITRRFLLQSSKHWFPLSFLLLLFLARDRSITIITEKRSVEFQGCSYQPRGMRPPSHPQGFHYPPSFHHILPAFEFTVGSHSWVTILASAIPQVAKLIPFPPPNCHEHKSNRRTWDEECATTRKSAVQLRTIGSTFLSDNRKDSRLEFSRVSFFS